MAMINYRKAAALRTMLNVRERMIGITSGVTPAVWLPKDAAWLRLPLAKRELGLRRLRIIREYDGIPVPTTSDARKAAEKMGVQLRSFYAMLRRWRETNRSPFALVPHSTEMPERKSRLDEAVAESLRLLSEKVVGAYPNARMRDLMSAVKTDWDSKLKIPSDVTLRAFLERAQSVVPHQRGSKIVDSLGFADQEPARWFGDVLIVDHTSFGNLLVMANDAAWHPTVTLLIDEFTGSPVGASAYADRPYGDGVVSALEDMVARFNRLAPGVGLSDATIVYAATFDREWSGLATEIQERGFNINETKRGTLEQGDAIRRYVGSSLDGIVLQSSRATRKAKVEEVDTEHQSLLSPDEMRTVISDAVERVFTSRVPVEERVGGRSAGRGDRAGRRTSLISPPHDGENVSTDPLEDFAAAQRLREGFWSSRASDGPRARLADGGYGGGRRSPGIFRRQLERFVKEVAGRYLRSMTISAPGAHVPGWLVEVVVNDISVRELVWLELAREAVELDERESTFVQFRVSTAGVEGSAADGAGSEGGA